MTAAWAVAGFHIGEAIGQEGANYVIAIIAGLISRRPSWSHRMGRRYGCKGLANAEQTTPKMSQVLSNIELGNTSLQRN